MVAQRWLGRLVLALLLGACGGARVQKLAWPDAPLELRDGGDRELATNAMWALPFGAPRDALRQQIVAATAQRIREALDDDHPLLAATRFDELIALWQADPQTIGQGLQTQLALVRELRAVLSKSGSLEVVVRILVVQAEVDASSRNAVLAELDAVLAFADELAEAENGAEAVRAQPIALLQPAVTALPLPWLVTRYLDLLVARQHRVADLLDHHGATLQLVRAHHDILQTSRRVAIVLAYADRVDELDRELARMAPASLGMERELVVRAEVVADQPTPDAYLGLAAALRDSDHAADVGAALAVTLAGLAKFPDSAALLAAAAEDARTLGRTDQAIALYERALGADAPDAVAALRLGKLYAERIGQLATGGRPRAATSAWQEVKTFVAAAAQRKPHLVWQQTAALAETALGRGLASQGMVDAGRVSLTRSLARAPSIDAYEALTTLETQVARYAAADRWASDGLGYLDGASAGDRYARARLERLDADALRLAGRTRDARVRYVDSLRAWASLGEAKDLPRQINVERLLDTGRALWWLGDQARGSALVESAVDFAADSPQTAANAVAFFLEIGRYTQALDACHRTLDEPEVPEGFKVYTSLWVLGDAKRQGLVADPLVIDYLGARQGDLWYEQLAKAATGRLGYAALVVSATTGPQHGELAFYGAVLGFAPEAATPAGRARLLRETVQARALFDAEYDLARLYLTLAP